MAKKYCCTDLRLELSDKASSWADHWGAHSLILHIQVDLFDSFLTHSLMRSDRNLSISIVIMDHGYVDTSFLTLTVQGDQRGKGLGRRGRQSARCWSSCSQPWMVLWMVLWIVIYWSYVGYIFDTVSCPVLHTFATQRFGIIAYAARTTMIKSKKI